MGAGVRPDTLDPYAALVRKRPLPEIASDTATDDPYADLIAPPARETPTLNLDDVAPRAAQPIRLAPVVVSRPEAPPPPPHRKVSGPVAGVLPELEEAPEAPGFPLADASAAARMARTLAPAPLARPDATRLQPEDNPNAVQLTGVPRALTDVFQSLADNPVETATAILAAPVFSAFTLGRYLGQQGSDAEADAEASRSIGIEPVSGREGAFAAAQTVLMGGGGILSGLVGQGVRRALGALGASPVVARGIGGTVGAGAEGAAVGAAYDEEHPGRGALLGAPLGIAANEIAGLARRRAMRGMPDEAPRRRTQEPDRQLPRRKIDPDARMRPVAEPPAGPYEPDVTFEDPYADLMREPHTVRPVAERPPAPTPPAQRPFKSPRELVPLEEPTLAEVEAGITRVRAEPGIDPGERQSRLNMLESQRRKLTGEPEPDVAGADRARAARAAGVRTLPDEAAAPASPAPAPEPARPAPIEPPAGAGAAEAAKAAPVEKVEHDYSSTQLDLPPEAAAGIRSLAARIPDADLAKDGREDAPHITVKYGLHGNEPEKVRALLADEPPITVTLGKTSIFPAGESGSGDVVKVDVESPALRALNKKIADALPHTDTHPDYKPHATVAYVKPGLGEKYAGDAALEGQTITLDRLTFSGKDGTTVEIPLAGGAPAAPAEPGRAAKMTERDERAWMDVAMKRTRAGAPWEGAKGDRVRLRNGKLGTVVTIGRQIRIQLDDGTFAVTSRPNLEPAPASEGVGAPAAPAQAEAPAAPPKKPVTPQVPAMAGMTPLGAAPAPAPRAAASVPSSPLLVQAAPLMGKKDAAELAAWASDESVNPRERFDRLVRITQALRTATGAEQGQGMTGRDVQAEVDALRAGAPASEPSRSDDPYDRLTTAPGEEAMHGPVRGSVPDDVEGAPAGGVPAPAGDAGAPAGGGRPGGAGAGAGVGARPPDAPEGPGAGGVPAAGPAPSDVDRAGTGDRGRGDRGVRGPGRALAERPGGNYRLTTEAARALVEGGLVAKAKRNLDAIRLLKTIEAEGRPATGAEQEALSGYTGWGAQPHLFDPEHAKYAPLGPALRELLTDAEWEAARATTPNAHYTSPEVIEGIHALLGRLGFTAGRALEPSMGAGYFLGLTPEASAGAIHWTGVELDQITGRIARLLYPESDVNVMGFQELQRPDAYYDVAVGNVPFGNYKVSDPRYNKLGLSIHNYFFRKSLDLVRPGGLVAYITSPFTMDAKSSAVRTELAKHAALVGAVRLPSTAFKGIAGTDVTTDLIILQRKGEGVAEGDSWAKLSPVTVPGREGPVEIGVNEYFARHPENILGELRGDGTMIARFGAESEMTVKGTGDLGALLRAAVERFPAAIYAPAAAPDVAGAAASLPEVAPAEMKDRALTVVNGSIVQKRAGLLVPAKVPAKSVPRVTQLIGLRDLATRALTAQLNDEPESVITSTRKALDRAYTAFVKEHGPIRKEVRIETSRTDKEGNPIIQVRYPNLQHFDDADAPLVAALEHYDPETGTAKKADILERRVFEPKRAAERADSPADALPMVLAERGKVDIPRIAQLTGVSEEEAVAALAGQVFADPAHPGRYMTLDEYTSGDVKTKLLEAEAAAEKDPDRWAANVAALKPAIPKDLLPSQIGASLGARWIPTSDYERFVNDVLGPGSISIRYTAAANIGYKVQADWRITSTVQATTEFGTKRMDAIELLEKALNLQSPTVYGGREEIDGQVVEFYDRVKDKPLKNPVQTVAAQEKQELLKERFAKWVWEDGARAARLAAKYNLEHNRVRLPTPDGSHLQFPGMAGYVKGQPFALRAHQKNAVWRIVTYGNTLLAHEVGTGKTYTMVAASMELRRLGLAKKPMHIVLKHMLEQYAVEFKQAYPGANVLVATDEDFAMENRKEFVARAAQNNWDAIIMGQSSFERIPMSQEYRQAFIRRELDQLEDAIREAKRDRGGQSRSIIKQVEKAKFNLAAKLDAMMAEQKKDDLLSFEQLGVDMLFVDEADSYKNLSFQTKMEGVAAPDAQKSFDLFMKSQYLEQINPGRGMVFATGTPIANAVAEVYTMQRYLQLPALRRAGLSDFDSWAAMFGRTVTGVEMRPDASGFRVKTRFAQFQNVGEMAQLFLQVMDVQRADDLGIPRPPVKGGGMRMVETRPSGPLREYVQELARRADRIASGKVDPTEDNMLKVTSDGRKAALDMRLVDPEALDLPDSKINRAVESIYERWQRTTPFRGTQLVFADLYATGPGGTGLPGFNVYEEVRAKLIAAGVPRAEIRFASEAKNDAQKAKLKADVRAGRVRILIGSTEKMGAGMNVQDRLVGLSHLDAPHRPRDVEQRNGRIVRQGNLLFAQGLIDAVELDAFLASGSFDGYMWQGLERKDGFIQTALKADASTRTIEDVDEIVVDWATAKAIASGNPKVKEKADVDAQVQKLDRSYKAWRDERFVVEKELRELPGKIETTARELHALAADAAAVEDTSGDHFAVTIGGATVTKRPEAGAMLQAAVAKEEKAGAMLKKGESHTTPIGRFAGFELSTHVVRSNLTETRDIYLQLKGEDNHFTHVGDNASAGSLVMLLEHLPKKIAGRADHVREELTSLQGRYARLQERSGGGEFPKAAELDALKKRQQQLDTDLKTAAAEAAKPAAPAVAPGTEPTPRTPIAAGSAQPLYGFADPFTAAYAMFRQAQAMRRARMGLPPKPPAAPLQAVVAKLLPYSRALQVIFNPAAVTPAAGAASRTMRAYRGDMDRSIAQAHAQLEAVREAFEALAPGPLYDGPRWQAYREMEEGIVPTDPTMHEAWQLLRKLQDAVASDVRNLGKGHLDAVNEDYMARVYVPLTGPRAARATAIYGAKRPFEGPKGFKRARTHEGLEESIEAALAKGLGPPTDNPVDMVMLKIREMRRYLMAHRIMQEWKDEGVVQFVRVMHKTPDGYARIDSPAFTVFGARGAQGEQRIRGYYVAPVEVARLMNNYLAPGLRGNPVYDAYSWLGNTMNIVQLGLSGFHAGFVAFDATVQFAQIGLDQILTGVRSGRPRMIAAGAGKLAVSAASAITGPATILPLPAATLSYLHGRRMFRAYLDDASTGQLEALVQMVTKGGGRHEMDKYYQAGNVQAFRRALTDRRLIPAVFWAPFAAVETTMKPLLEHIVPRMKMGAAFYAMEAALAKLPAGATEDEVRKAAARAWDNIDARLGQMVYDNRFWHRITKEVLMLSIRSVGWNVGSLDVTVGAVSQAAQNVAGLPRGKTPEDWSKVQYLVALGAVVALYGAAYTYLHTGDLPGEIDGEWQGADFLGKDLYFPRNGSTDIDGNPGRMTPATYMKDVFALAKHPVQTVQHKLHPMLSTLSELILTNENFYGDQIRNPEDPMLFGGWGETQASQLAEYVGKDVALPFSVRNMAELRKRGEGTLPKVEGFFGTQAAPRRMTRTAAQNQMMDYLARKGSGGSRTPEQQDEAERRSALMDRARRHELTGAALDSAEEAGHLTVRQRNRLEEVQDDGEDVWLERFKRLSVDEALKVYKLTRPDERARYRDVLEQKLDRADRGDEIATLPPLRAATR